MKDGSGVHTRDAVGAESFTILSLPLVDAGGRTTFSSVRAALDDYIDTPFPVEVEDWQCLCAGFAVHRAQVLKTHRIVQLPEALLIHLVRWDSLGGVVPHPVSADAVLDVSGTAGVGTFSLMAVVIHTGPTPRRGHYYTFAKHGGTWWLYDDAHTRAATESEIAFFTCGHGATETKKVYLAFYERVGRTVELSADGPVIVAASSAAL